MAKQQNPQNPQTENNKGKTKVVNCSCQNAGQDNLYGIGKRLANKLFKDGYRCTVCKTIHK